MKTTIPIRTLFIILLLSPFGILCSQSEFNTDNAFNTKRNFVFLNGSLGGGDYPFAGLGITLSRQFFKGETMAGLSVQYIGNTVTGEFIDPVQVFPVMLDLRQKFMESRDGRFSSFVIFNAGYVISITQNGLDNEGEEFEYKNGWGVNPGVAFRINIFENVGIMFDITWFHHRHPTMWLSPVAKKSSVNWNTGLVRGNIFF